MRIALCLRASSRILVQSQYPSPIIDILQSDLAKVESRYLQYLLSRHPHGIELVVDVFYLMGSLVQIYWPVWESRPHIYKFHHKCQMTKTSQLRSGNCLWCQELTGACLQEEIPIAVKGVVVTKLLIIQRLVDRLQSLV